jgi:CRP-like cAMP-binding protein
MLNLNKGSDSMIDLFKDIDDKNKIKLLKELEAQTYDFKKGTSLLSSILIKDMLGIVIDGIIQIVKTDYNGNRVIVEELVKNDIFGNNISFYIDDSCEILTKVDSKIILFDYEDIINYKHYDEQYYNQFIMNLLEAMHFIVTVRNERIRILTQKTIRNKLLEFFNILSKKYGSRTIYLPFSYTDLADYLAVDRSAMSREIKHLKEEKIIEVKNRKIMLLYR